MIWIVDCSFTSALFLNDDAASKVKSFFDQLSAQDQAWVPALWWHETANTLTIAEKQKRLTKSDTSRMMALISQLPLTTDESSGPFYLQHLYELASAHQLSAYDAAYLELALRKSGALATFDKQLAKAAHAAGVKLV